MHTIGPLSEDQLAIQDGVARTVAQFDDEYWAKTDETGDWPEAFCDAMAAHQADVVHVHCIYNARVTAFMTRYAAEGRGWDLAEARARMDGIWRPGGPWARFLGDETRLEKPNEFSGYEY